MNGISRKLKKLSFKTLSLVIVQALALGFAQAIHAAPDKSAATTQDVLVKIAPQALSASKKTLSFLRTQSKDVRPLLGNWYLVKAENPRIQSSLLRQLSKNPAILHVQPNYKIKLLTDYSVQDKNLRARILNRLSDAVGAGPGDLGGMPIPPVPLDNPAIPPVAEVGQGADPEFSKQWGMLDIGVAEAWKTTTGDEALVVGVIDSGVDYTHPDLLPNMWRNPGESGDKSANGIDDDGNGFVDDVMGWDFVQKDNKPFDLPVDVWQMIVGGGNPGHGTHCAGNVAARGNNGIGISGVAPNVKIMALRFISEKGEGTTADAIGAIKYGVDMGAKILSNSWGSEGENPEDPTSNQALRDAVTYAEQKGVLFVAAAGNGHSGVGYDNDSDPKPAYPASYPHSNIISVAALDVNNSLGSFSNWGATSVDIGAPGVAIFSTTVGGGYSDKVIDIPGLITATWDGTSMAAPHVAGAAALYWSKHPTKSLAEVKAAILESAKRIDNLTGKAVSQGKLDVGNLLK